MARADPRKLEVVAAIRSSEGWATGGSFAVVAMPARNELAHGMIDNWGEIAVNVNVPTEAEAIMLVVGSRGALRNCADSVAARGAAPGSMALLSPFDFRLLWRRFGVSTPVEYSASRPEDFAATLPLDEGASSADLVRRTLRVDAVRDGRLDFGEMRYVTTHDAVEILVRLVGESGEASSRRCVLAGLYFNPRTLHGNELYPHFAYAQRGDRARIVLTRAAWRLLRRNPDSLIRIAPEDQTGWWNHVQWTEESRMELEQGGRRLSGSCVLRPWNEGPDRREVVHEPDWWDLGEAAFGP